MKILLAVDGSENSKRAAEKAIELTKEIASPQITVIAVLNHFTPSIYEISKQGYFEKLVEAHKKYNDSILDKYQTFFQENGRKVNILSKFGDPVEEIIKEADNGNYDFLLVGSRGLSTLKRTALGSVSYNLVQNVSIPIMVVK